MNTSRGSESNLWQGTIPVYINNFNWLTPVQNIAAFIDRIPGTEVTIVDNASTFAPLLEWYATCRYRVVRLDENIGEHAPWACGAILPSALHRERFGSDYYVVTDPDLSLESCPVNVLEVLVSGWLSYPSLTKIGLSLEIDDLPDTSPMANNVKMWESQFWRNRRDERFFEADVDTTFALYRCDVPFIRAQTTGNSLRSDRPYTARHLPWYIDPDHVTVEEEYYIRTTRKGHWGTFLQRVLAERG